MPSPNQVFTEIVTTTFRNHGSEITDNVSNHNAFYRRLKKNGRTRKESGGYSIVMPLEYAENGTYQRFSGFDTLNIAQSDVFSAAEFPWRMIAINVVNAGWELRVNNGPQQIANLAKKRIRNAISSFANNFSFDLYSDGTLPNQINGTQALIADSGLGTVGGIDSSVWPFWQNQVLSGVALTAANIESRMLSLFISLTRGADKPSLILASDDFFSLYEQSQVAMKRYVNRESADGGFMELDYKGVPVIFDGSSGMVGSRMYFVNDKYFELVVHSQANLTPLDEARPYNQDAAVIPMIWQGNACVSNRRLQGVLLN